MVTQLERRSAPLEVRGGRTIGGLALPWGARARLDDGRIETFTRGAFNDLKPVPLYLEHRGPVIGEVQPSDTTRGLEVEGSYEGDLQSRSRFSIEFRARLVTKSEGLRIVSSALLEGVASVRQPIYRDAVIEHRQRGASLLLLEGPVASGKSEVLRNLLSTDAVDVVADLTPLWSAVKLLERDPSGNYPERTQADPALRLALYLKVVTARRALSEGLRVAVSTSTPNQASKWRVIADEFSASFDIQLVDPGQDVVRERLGGTSISSECESAVQNWYGSSRSAVLSQSRRRQLLAAV